MSCIFHCRFIGLMALTVATVSCADSSTSPSTSATSVARASRGVSEFVAPASIGWQEQARTLVAANNLSPLAAERVYAALSVAQYHAVLAVDNSDTDGLLP